MAAASYYTMSTTKLMLLLVVTFSSLQYFPVSSFEYQVGDSKGWIVPSVNGTRIYNDWASKNRFQVGDTIRFRYKKDSVMEVTEEDYKNCNSSHPFFFSNTGNTIYKLDHPGAFYFMSGVYGHCQKGQKIIIKVMLPEDEYNSHKENKNSGGSHPEVLSRVVLIQLLLFYVGYCVLH